MKELIEKIITRKSYYDIIGGGALSKNNEDFFKEKKQWSIIKDQLLGCYLKPYFSKILATQKPIFYVDAFAGKGRFEDGNAGSPIIALNIISESLQRTKFNQSDVELCLIELNHANALRNNVKHFKNVAIVEGKYEDNIERLLVGKKMQNVFLYIDPYGVKVLDFSIFEKISEINLYSIEMLINFNSFGFIREACNAMNTQFDAVILEDLVGVDNLNVNNLKSIQDLNKVAGGTYWQAIIEEYKNKTIDGYEAEKKFSEQYCKNLKEHFKYVLNMPIRLQKGQRPKYRMIHATNHAQGCALMNDNMYKRWEALQTIQNHGQISMFTEDIENISVNKEELQKEILEIMKLHKEYIDIDIFLAEFISKYGVRVSTSDICKELDKLCNDNNIEVVRNPKFTPKGKISKFWTVSKGHSVKVRCT